MYCALSYDVQASSHFRFVKASHIISSIFQKSFIRAPLCMGSVLHFHEMLQPSFFQSSILHITNHVSRTTYHSHWDCRNCTKRWLDDSTITFQKHVQWMSGAVPNSAATISDARRRIVYIYTLMSLHSLKYIAPKNFVHTITFEKTETFFSLRGSPSWRFQTFKNKSERSPTRKWLWSIRENLNSFEKFRSAKCTR